MPQKKPAWFQAGYNVQSDYYLNEISRILPYLVRRRVVRRAFGLRATRRREVARQERVREVERLAAVLRVVGFDRRVVTLPLLNAFFGPFCPLQTDGLAFLMLRSTAL